MLPIKEKPVVKLMPIKYLLIIALPSDKEFGSFRILLETNSAATAPKTDVAISKRLPIPKKITPAMIQGIKAKTTSHIIPFVVILLLTCGPIDNTKFFSVNCH